MITYTWTVTKLECYAKDAGQTDVVFMTYWTCSGTDGFYQGAVSGTQSLIYTPGSAFTPYPELTEPQVVNWIQAAMGPTLVAQFEADVTAQINAQTTPVIVTPPLPWA